MSAAFIFPGQGSQSVGMGKDLADAFPEARRIFDEVDEALGEKLSTLIWEGPEETLTLTANAQPALMAVSLATIRALEARLREAHQRELEAERQANAEEARAFLETLGKDVGETVAARVSDMEGRVVRLVSDSVARMIGGILSDDLQKRSLDALARAVRSAAADAESTRVEIRGPLSLFEPLKAALGARADNLHFVEAPGFDLSLIVDDTVFETRMAEWSAALAEVLP